MNVFIDQSQMKVKDGQTCCLSCYIQRKGRPKGGSIVSVDPLLFFQTNESWRKAEGSFLVSGRLPMLEQEHKQTDQHKYP